MTDKGACNKADDDWAHLVYCCFQIESSSNPLWTSREQQNDYLFVPEKSHVAMLDLDTGERVKTLSGHYSNVKCLRFNPNQLELYSGGKDKYIHIWSPESEQNENTVNNQITCDNWSDSEWLFKDSCQISIFFRIFFYY